MAKQDCEAQDDWQAFYSIQLMRYLRGFKKRTLSNSSERSMIYDVIQEAWTELQSSGRLDGRSSGEKCEIFQNTKIDFPLFAEAQVGRSLPLRQRSAILLLLWAQSRGRRAFDWSILIQFLDFFE
jgi:hypothetical protein